MPRKAAPPISKTKTKTIAQQQAEWILDPLKFISVFWPQIRIYDKQAEILYSLRDNDETIVPAGNQLGKDFITGLAVLWFFCSRKPCHVITSSSSQVQLRSVLWGEINNFIQTAKHPLPIEVTDNAIYQVNQHGDRVPKSYLLGVVTNIVETMQGHHLARHGRPRCLAVFDECSAIEDPYYNAVDTWAHRKLSIGNPLPCNNFFKKKVKGGDVPRPGKHFFTKIIRIRAEDSPNVQRGLLQKAKGLEPDDKEVLPGVISYSKYVERRQLWNPIQQCVGLDACFYEGAESMLFPPARLNKAEENAARLAGMPRRAVSLGVDPAEGGDDTVWTLADRAGVIKQISKKTPDTSVIVQETIQLIKEHGLDCNKVFFDRGGGGKQHADNLRKLGYPVHTIAFGESVSDPDRFKRMQTSEEKKKASETRYAYKNRRAQLYHLMSLFMDPNHIWENQVPDANGRYAQQEIFAIPAECTELRRQLEPLPLLYDGEGRIYLPPKEAPTPGYKGVTIKSIIGCSPDEADSCVLAVYGVLMSLRRVVQAGSSLV